MRGQIQPSTVSTQIALEEGVQHGTAYAITMLALFAIPLRVLLDLLGESHGSLGVGGAAGLAVPVMILITSVIAGKSHYYLLKPYLLAAIVSTIIYIAVDLLSTAPRPENYLPFEYEAKFLCAVIPFSFLVNSPVSHQSRTRLGRSFYWIYLATLLVPTAIAFGQFLGYFSYTYYDIAGHTWVGRPSGGYRQPSSLARLFVFEILFTYIASEIGVNSSRIFKYAIIFGSLLMLVFITHRMSLLIGLTIVIAMEWRRPARALVVGVMVLPLLAFGLFFTGAGSRVLNSTSVQVLLNVIQGSSGFSLRGRPALLAQAVKVFAGERFQDKIFGLGFEPFTTDNAFATILLAQGVVGLGLFVLVMYLSFRAIFRKVIPSRRRYVALLLATIVGYGMILDAHTATLLWWEAGAAVFLLGGGVIASGPRVSRFPANAERPGS